MAVWRVPSAMRAKPQSRKNTQLNSTAGQADLKEEEIDLSGLDIHKLLAERSPEQTALIALRGLLEAREMYIQQLEVRTTIICSTSSEMAQCAILTENWRFRPIQREQSYA